MSEQMPSPMPDNLEDQKRVKDDLLEMAALPDSASDKKSIEAHLSEMDYRVKANEDYIAGEMKKGRTAKDVMREIGEEKAKRLIGEGKFNDFLQNDMDSKDKDGIERDSIMPDDPSARKEVEDLLDEMRQREIQKEIQSAEIESVSKAVKDGRSPKEILKDLGGYDEAAEIIGKDFADELVEMIEASESKDYLKGNQEKGEK